MTTSPVTDLDAHHPGGPEARRRPVRLRTLQGPPEALAALAREGASVLGTSHRQAPVKNLVGGSARASATCSRCRRLRGHPGQRRHHGVLGRRRARPGPRAGAAPDLRRVLAKFATVTRKAPFLADPSSSPPTPATRPSPAPAADVDVYAWAHNETSTGVAVPVRRPAGADRRSWCWSTRPPAPAACRSTSPRPTSTTSPRRRCSASDGGLWIALPPGRAGPDRRDRRHATGGSRSSCRSPPRWTTPRKDQTLNTPAVATLFLLADQIDWMHGNGGLDWAPSAPRTRPAGCTTGPRQRRSRPRSSPTRSCARRSSAPSTSPTPSTPPRSAKTLRANGIVDTEPYRKLGRNQLRIGMFPAVEPDDVSALTACIDYVVERLGR